MNRTKIEYLDFTWNPGVGCSGVGCAVREKCWARRCAKRQKCSSCKSFIPHVHPERLTEPLKLSKPAVIGCCFMGEFFELDCTQQLRILNVIRAANWHKFLILTKQPQRIPYQNFPNNLWIGVSINTVGGLWRLADLKNLSETTHKFISFEPLYEDLKNANLNGIEWIIIGAQTRPLKMPSATWITNLVDKAENDLIPFFLKNNLYVSKTPAATHEFPKDLEVVWKLRHKRSDAPGFNWVKL